MIELATGDLFAAQAEALVNTVNTVGIMGKGLALLFKRRFPDNFRAYKKACDAGEVVSGKVFIFDTGELVAPRYIINFPTKRHWRQPSQLVDIEQGLEDLIAQLDALKIRSVAVPPLGCGAGGLDWRQVKPRIEAAFSQLPEVKVLLFAPGNTPDAEAMPVTSSRPKMTPGRAGLLGVFDAYLRPGHRMGKLEAQKLAYFIEQAGTLMNLNFVAHQFGPYSEVLNHVLQRVEGHYVIGYGDRTNESRIRPIPDAVAEAKRFIDADPETQARVAKVKALIDGFETPYGLELLATVHWLASHSDSPRDDVQAAIKGVHGWNKRKRDLFKPGHIQAAWEQLHDQGWLAGS